MDEPITTVLTPTKPARKSRKRTPSGPRKIDPGIAAIHEETRKRIAAYRKTQNSSKILATIINKRLEQLTEADKQKLFGTLSGVVTVTLDNQNP